MATFWTGSALAADYGQNRIQALKQATRVAFNAADDRQLARREAFTCLNKAIRMAVMAQFDEQEPPQAAEANDQMDDDLLMHCGCLECFPYAQVVTMAEARAARI